ncbi:TPA: hydrogenase maturation nickel metallochaperone HypA [Candidatus Poribacteria bacterium]|nr:hydrogenase maturation nickel metallochaperone HypA [Candidatus Poribacteria bacterium]
MHEISLIESIIDIVLSEMSKNNITKVSSISLKIGKMLQVMEETLRFGFEIMSQNTPLEGAEIIIENTPVIGRCKNCGNEFQIDDWFDSCPNCHQMCVEIISGKEMEIISFEGY